LNSWSTIIAIHFFSEEWKSCSGSAEKKIIIKKIEARKEKWKINHRSWKIKTPCSIFLLASPSTAFEISSYNKESNIRY
jgi:hypothetical protein